MPSACSSSTSPRQRKPRRPVRRPSAGTRGRRLPGSARTAAAERHVVGQRLKPALSTSARTARAWKPRCSPAPSLRSTCCAGPSAGPLRRGPFPVSTVSRRPTSPRGTETFIAFVATPGPPRPWRCSTALARTASRRRWAPRRGPPQVLPVVERLTSSRPRPSASSLAANVSSAPVFVVALGRLGWRRPRFPSAPARRDDDRSAPSKPACCPNAFSSACSTFARDRRRGR